MPSVPHPTDGERRKSRRRRLSERGAGSARWQISSLAGIRVRGVRLLPEEEEDRGGAKRLGDGDFSHNLCARARLLPGAGHARLGEQGGRRDG